MSNTSIITTDENHHHTLLVLKKLSDALTCKICNKVTTNPHTVGGCGHYACHKCLTSLKQSLCPICKQQFYPYDLVPDAIVKTMLNEWKVISEVFKRDLTVGKDEKTGPVVPDKSCIKDIYSDTNKLVDVQDESNSKASCKKVKETDNSSENVKRRSADARRIRHSSKLTSVSRKEEFDALNEDNFTVQSDSDCNQIEHSKTDTDVNILDKKVTNGFDKRKDVKSFKSIPDKNDINKKDGSLENPVVMDDRAETKAESCLNKGKENKLKRTSSELEVDRNEISINSRKLETNKKSGAVFSPDYVVTPPTKKYLSIKQKLRENRKEKVKELPQLNLSVGSDEEFKGFDLQANNISKNTKNEVPNKKKQSLKRTNVIVQKVVNRSRDKLFITGEILKLVNDEDSNDNPIDVVNIDPSDAMLHKDTEKNETTNSKVRYAHDRKMSTDSNDSVNKDLSILSSSLSSSSKKKDVMKRNKKGETPLQVACAKGKLDIVKKLLEEGADPNTKDYAGWTPLHEAVEKGHVALVETLLNAGAFVNTPGYFNITPLLEAVIKDNIVIARLLVQHCADVSLRSRYNYLPINCASSDDMKKLLSIYEMKSNKTNCSPDYSSCTMPTPAILTGVSLDDSQVKFLQKFCKNFNLTYIDNFRHDVTHIIVNDKGSLTSTLEISLLQGILNGAAIISFKWVEHCADENCLLEPVRWEINGTEEFPDSKAPLKSRYYSQKLFPKLFDGLHVYLESYWPKSDKFSKADITNLLKDGGAVILQRKPDPESIPSEEMTVMFHAEVSGPMSICSHLLLYSPGPNEPQLKYNMKHIKTLPVKWLLDCIQTFSIRTM